MQTFCSQAVLDVVLICISKELWQLQEGTCASVLNQRQYLCQQQTCDDKENGAN